MARSCGRGKGKEEGEKRGKRRRPKIAFLEPFQALWEAGNAISELSSTRSTCSKSLASIGAGETDLAKMENREGQLGGSAPGGAREKSPQKSRFGLNLLYRGLPKLSETFLSRAP